MPDVWTVPRSHSGLIQPPPHPSAILMISRTFELVYDYRLFIDSTNTSSSCIIDIIISNIDVNKPSRTTTANNNNSNNERVHHASSIGHGRCRRRRSTACVAQTKQDSE